MNDNTKSRPCTNGISAKIQILSGAQLKYIAFASMLMDHVNKALIYPYLGNSDMLDAISDLFEILGRIAFPLFAFFLVEGYFHTHSRWKYLRNLLLFGVISEIPFDLFATAQYVNVYSNNIMFTLAMMLVMIWVIDALKQRIAHRALWYLLSVPIVAGMCLLSMVTGVDYEYHALLTAYFLYLFHGRTLAAIPFSFISLYKEPWLLLGFGLTLTYNGERGRQYKLFNYLFYPVHLLILGLLRMALGV